MDGPHTAATLVAAAHPALRALLALPHLRQATALARALLTVRLLPSLAFTASDVTAYLEADSFAVLLLHLGRPDPGGLVAAVRRRSPAPILALGAERQPSERVGALRCEGYAPDTLAPAALARRAVALTRSPTVTPPTTSTSWRRGSPKRPATPTATSNGCAGFSLRWSPTAAAST